MPPDDFAAMVGLAKSGDRSAMDWILNEIQPLLGSWALQVLRGAPDVSVSDVIQVSRVAIWEHIDQFDGAENGRVAFFAWARRVVHTRAINYVRDLNRQCRRPAEPVVSIGGSNESSSAERNPIDPAANSPSPSELAVAEEESRRIQNAIEMLPSETDRAVIRKHFFEDQSLPQIAAELGLPFEEVRRLYRRCMRLLEDALAD